MVARPLTGQKGGSHVAKAALGTFFYVGRLELENVSKARFDFEVSFPCSHSECDGSHILTIRVVDKCYEALKKKHQETFSDPYNTPSPALFGDGPNNTFWETAFQKTPQFLRKSSADFQSLGQVVVSYQRLFHMPFDPRRIGSSA